MKPKQLANVLVKILGLSITAHQVAPLIYLLAGWHSGMGNNFDKIFFATLLGVFIPIAIGIILMVQSRKIVEKLFHDEPE